MPNLEDIIRAQRKRLLEKEADLIAAISGDFNAAIAELESRAIDAAALVQKRIDQGENPLSAQITERRIGTFLEAVGDIISDVALDALNYTLADRKSAQIAAASDFVDAANASDVRAGIDPDAIRRIALGINAPDSPIRRLFANLPELAQSRARDALFQGVALGDNPRQTGRRVAAAAGIAKARAQTIARTETMRAYRNGTLDRMQVTPEIHRWVWIAARDRRTCAMCWAMHGRVFSTERQMGTHPNCRCSMGPLPLGANTTAIVGNGKALFDKLKPSEQLQILGGAKYRAFKNGAIDLSDLIGTAQHVDWGEIRYERSLSSVLGKTNAMKYYRGALNLTPKVQPPKPAKAPKPPAAIKPKAAMTPKAPARTAIPKPKAPPARELHVEFSGEAGYIGAMARYRASLAAVPADVRNLLAQAGVSVYIGGSVRLPQLDNLGYLAGVQPRGWPPGKTWEDVGGVYAGGGRRVVAVSAKGGDGSADVVLHELGHAFDYAVQNNGRAAFHPEFRAMHERAKSRLKPYFRQEGEAGLSEWWAESFAEAFTPHGQKGSMPVHDLVRRIVAEKIAKQ